MEKPVIEDPHELYMRERQQKLDEMHKYYLSLEMPNCPKCGSNENVKKIVIGRPTQELAEYASQEYSKVLLGGCMMEPGKMRVARCVTCKEDIYEEE